MKWLLIYLLCAIATAIFFGFIAKYDDEDVFKRDRVIAISSMCIIGASFPIVWVVAVAIVAKANYRTWRARKKWK